jgi:hypothetical protein
MIAVGKLRVLLNDPGNFPAIVYETVGYRYRGESELQKSFGSPGR